VARGAQRAKAIYHAVGISRQKKLRKTVSDWSNRTEPELYAVGSIPISAAL